MFILIRIFTVKYFFSIKLSLIKSKMNCLKKTFLIISISIFSINTFAQVVNDTGQVFIEMSSIISDMPGDSGNDYKIPTDTQFNSWGQVLESLFKGDYTTASDTANTLDYNLIHFLDTSQVPNKAYFILKATGTNYWGTYVYNPNYCRTVVVQSPHPKKDFNTGKEGIHVFHETQSFFFMLSGTNRCNHSFFSTCDGTTSVCTADDSSEKYRISDLAHNLSTIYQNTTDTLFSKFSNTYFLQLHGFGKKGTDPFIILSNGTQVTPSTDYIPTLKTNLENEDPLFVDSIKVAHVDLTWDRLRGFGNVQGRLINSSVDQCNSNATTTNGRFIHMEQEKLTLRADETGWTKVSNAVTNTFPCTATILPVTLLYFNIRKETNQKVSCEWSTVSEINNDYFTIERSKDGLLWEKVITINGAGNSSGTQKYKIIDQEPYTGISYYRLKQTDFDGQFEYSQVRSTSVKLENTSLKVYPNPTINQITIKGNESELKEVKIYNTIGQDVTASTQQILNNDTTLVIDLSKLVSGIYYIKTKTTVKKIYKH